MPKRKPRISVARAYDARPTPGTFRVLVDRLWPRGIKKDDLELDLWMKELAPSAELRRWFNHEPSRWIEFRKRYFKELEKRAGAALSDLLETADGRPIVLIYGARDEQHNNAVALKEFVEQVVR